MMRAWLVRMAVAAAGAAVLSIVLYRAVVPWLVLHIYRSELPEHRLVEADRNRGAGTSDVYYLATAYDCRRGELRIDGVAPDATYWMVGIYDAYARGVPGGHLNHRTVAMAADGHFELLVTPHPDGRPNTLDCRTTPQGMLIYRVLLPRSAVTVPSITVVTPAARFGASRPRTAAGPLFSFDKRTGEGR